MSYCVEYGRQPQKFLEKLDKHIAGRLTVKIEGMLSNNPVPHDAKTIVGEHGVFRLRVGDYRAFYCVDYPLQKIAVFKIEKREKAY